MVGMSDLSEVDSGSLLLSFQVVITNAYSRLTTLALSISSIFFLNRQSGARNSSREYTALKQLSNPKIEIPNTPCTESPADSNRDKASIDCCFNNCIAFTNGYSDATECLICNERAMEVTYT